MGDAPPETVLEGLSRRRIGAEPAARNYGPDEIEERRQALARRAQEFKNTYDTTWMWGMMALSLLVIVFLLAAIGLQDGTAGGKKRADSGRGDFGSQQFDTFINNATVRSIEDMMELATLRCTPTSNAVLDQINFGTAAQTQQQLTLILNDIAPTGDPPMGCYFYGLEIAAQRTATVIGPDDLCEAYTKAGLVYLAVELEFQLPANLNQILERMYDIAWPLNIWWKRVYPDHNAVASSLRALLLDAISNDDFDAQRIAKAFCTPYFATNDPDHYRPTLQAWLGFPFPGTFQRSGDTFVASRARALFSNITLGSTSGIKKFYSIGDVFDVSPSARLFIDAVRGSLPLQEFVSGSPTSNLAQIVDEITDSNGDFIGPSVPVFVIGRYAESPSEYLSFPPVSGQVLYGVTDADPDQILDVHIDDIITSASAPNSISVLDVITVLDFEYDLGSQFIMEQHAAELIDQVISGQLSAGLKSTGEILETFMVKNVIIDGEDIGGRMVAQEQANELVSDGFGTGFSPLAFGLAADAEVVSQPLVFGSQQREFFDFRESYPRCVGEVYNQGDCNNCYVWGAVDAIAMRFCKEGRTPRYEPISVQHVTSCSGDPSTDGCEPSHPFIAYTFMAQQGALEEDCLAYQNAVCQPGRSCEVPCMKQCGVLKQSYSRFTTVASSNKIVKNVDAQKDELFRNGPFPVGGYLPSDFSRFFRNNPMGIYTGEGARQSRSNGHIVTLVGWDDRGPIPYWIMKNTWGENWGNGGYFRVAQDIVVLREGVGIWFDDNGFVADPRNIQSFDQAAPLPQASAVDPVIIVNPDQAAELIIDTTTGGDTGGGTGGTGGGGGGVSSSPARTPFLLLVFFLQLLCAGMWWI